MCLLFAKELCGFLDGMTRREISGFWNILQRHMLRFPTLSAFNCCCCMCRCVWDKEENFPPPLATGTKQPLWLQKRELLLYPQGWKNNLKSEGERESVPWSKHNNSTWNKKSENRGKEAKKWLSWASMWESVQALSSFRSLVSRGMGTRK